MEEQVQRLVEQTWERFQNTDASQRYLIAISGIPGSGKTTLAAGIVHGLNKLQQDTFHQENPSFPEANLNSSNPFAPNVAIMIPLDGYHLTREQLSKLPNAKEAIFRRGAAFTFDPKGYFSLVEKLRKPIEAATATIYAPSFDHRIKDPVQGDIKIPKTARLIIFEGLYTALDRDEWRDAAQLMDELWYVDVPFSVAEARVAKRNYAAGISETLELSLSRTRESDMKNARDVADARLPVQEIIKSVEDEAWKTQELKDLDEIHFQNEMKHAKSRPKTERVDSIAELVDSGAGM